MSEPDLNAPAIPEFSSATTTTPDASSTKSAPPYVFKLDGVTMSATRPKEALVAELAPVQSRRTPPMRKIQIALNFLDDCMLEPGKTILAARLTDPKDKLDVEHVFPILEQIGEHWKAWAAANR